MNRQNRIVATSVLILICLSACGFVPGDGIVISDSPGFFMGIWHGLIAPYTLIVRWFLDVKMYAINNTGWFYDLGFLIGVSGSLPIGWACAIIALIIHFIA